MKLALAEPESSALEEVTQSRHLVASELVEVESRRAVRRASPSAERLLNGPLGGVSFVPLDDEIRQLAGRLDPPALRTLDAIHLATALRVGGLDELIAYDRRLVAAARGQGMDVLSPA